MPRSFLSGVVGAPSKGRVHPMQLVLILNDLPYGTERCYNGLRLLALIKSEPGTRVAVFLMADAVVAAKGQKTPMATTMSNAC